MSDIVLEEEDEESGGGAGWLATFADLMSLLMCFFVLMLSFSEMDVLKYKQVAGSMANAFGVQNKVKAKDIPKGTSIIAQEFSPGRPNPTPFNVVQQSTVDIAKRSLETRSGPEGGKEKDGDYEAAQVTVRQKLQDDADADAETLAAALMEEIEAGMIDIESAHAAVTIRIRERGSFTSGSAEISPAFRVVMARLRGVLKKVEGAIAVEGHTDNVPIRNTLYRSNWDLSVGRALAVAHELMKDDDLDNDRFMVIGYGETQPQAPNDSAANRAQNRRVEIVIRRGFNIAPSGGIRGPNPYWLMTEAEISRSTGYSIGVPLPPRAQPASASDR